MEQFDIAGISQVAPAANAVVTLPYTFQWTTRPTTTQDHYMIRFDGSDTFSTGDLGYVDSYSFFSLPQGAPIGASYGYYWKVIVSWPDGSRGVQYGDSRVYFNSSGAASARDPFLLSGVSHLLDH